MYDLGSATIATTNIIVNESNIEHDLNDEEITKYE